MFPEQFIQFSGYFIHFLQYILYIRFDARHGSHILYLELSFMGYRFFSEPTLLLNSTSRSVLGHVQSVNPPQHVIVLLHSCAFLLRISVQTAQNVLVLLHTCAFLLRISVQTAQNVLFLLHSCAFLLQIPVQTAQHTSHLIHSCLSSPDTRPPSTTRNRSPPHLIHVIVLL